MRPLIASGLRAVSGWEFLMAATRFDVLGIGNAVVDVIARTEDDFLIRQKMRKGTMQLIDAAEATRIYDAMGPAIEVSGGSAANTIVGSAGLGARAAFIGKVRDDELGRVFAHDIRAEGAFLRLPRLRRPSTGRCCVGRPTERTMNTYLGAAQDLHPNDIDPEAIAATQIIYLEGYLWDPPHAKEAFLKAAKIAHGSERDVALTLSDAFCVDRYRADFLHLIRTGTVDLVFANERELHSLYETADFDTAVNALRNDARAAVITRSEHGCLVVTREETVAVPACPVERVVEPPAQRPVRAGFLVGGRRLRTSARLRPWSRQGHPTSRPDRDIAQGTGATMDSMFDCAHHPSGERRNLWSPP
jgi:adenosine kinase